MKTVILQIGGMSCSACSNGLEKYLRKQKGVQEASVNLVLAQATITYEENLSVKDLEHFVQEAGFESLGIFNPHQNEKKKSITPLLFYAFLMIVFMYISMGHMLHLPEIPGISSHENSKIYTLVLVILTIPFLIYGRDIFKNGIKNVLHKMPNMDTLVTLSVLVSLGYSLYFSTWIWLGEIQHTHQLYFESVAMVIYFIKLGRYIDNRSKEKTKEAIQQLVQITPTSALLKTKDGEREVTIDEVEKGDILIAKPGMKIAVDGIIQKGETHVDESFLTGESSPSKKIEAEEVIAGSINIDGYIEYEAKRIGRDSTISEMVKLVLQATSTKAPIARIADKVSGYFVPSVLAIAFLSFLGYIIGGLGFDQGFHTFVTVLVVACPCALGLATPLSMVVSVGTCAKNGILIKSNETLESAATIDTIVFDKTGTLTYGELKVSKIYHREEVSEQELLRMVASLEALSNHPISHALKIYANDHNLSLEPVTDFQNLPGIGITGTYQNQKVYVGNDKLFQELSIAPYYEQEKEKLSKEGNSLLYVICQRQVVGLIGVKDIVRADAKDTIEQLKRNGKEVMMLTGDNEKTARVIADSLSISHVVSDVLPKGKLEVIEKMLHDGKKVMMVGDGVNDAPSLALATIGVSVHSGTDIASDSSDILLMQDKLSHILLFLTISKKTMWNIKENLFWAFFYNIIMIPIAIGFLKPVGLTMNPMLASMAMTISSLTVVLNSLRLRKIK